MKSKLLLVVLLACFSATNAQIIYKLSRKGNEEDISGKTLLVGLYTIDKNKLAKMNPEEAEQYRVNLEFQNELRKNCINKYWTLKNPIVFKSIVDINEMSNESLKPYLRFVETDFFPQDYKASPGKEISASTYSLLSGKDFDLSFSISNSVDTEMDYKFVLHNLCKYAQGYMEKKPLLDPSLYNKEKNYATLQEKTLFFDINMLNQEKLTQEKAKEMYPHKIKFTTGDEIYTLLEKGDTSALYITYVYNESFGIWTYAIVDGVTMDVLALQPPNRVQFRIGAKKNYLGFHTVSLDNKHATTIWKNRTNIQLDERDFKYLGIKATVDRNYLNPLSGLK